MYKDDDVTNITIGQLYDLITMLSNKYSHVEGLSDNLASQLADLFEYEVEIPIDYLIMFGSLIK